MTLAQKKRYNKFVTALRDITKIRTVSECKSHCSKYGLDYQAYLEKLHMEMQLAAAEAVRNKSLLSLSDRSRE